MAWGFLEKQMEHGFKDPPASEASRAGVTSTYSREYSLQTVVTPVTVFVSSSAATPPTHCVPGSPQLAEPWVPSLCQDHWNKEICFHGIVGSVAKTSRSEGGYSCLSALSSSWWIQAVLENKFRLLPAERSLCAQSYFPRSFQSILKQTKVPIRTGLVTH